MNKRERALIAALGSAPRSRLHPNYYNGSGRWSRKSADHAGQLVDLLKNLGMVRGRHFTVGNDAPQGGWTGEYVRLLPLGRRRKAILDLRESVQ